MIKKTRNYFKISELSGITKTPIPTIRYYIKEGLLPPGLKTGKTSALYTDDHMERINRIKKFQTEDNLSLASIKDKLADLPSVTLNDQAPISGSSRRRDLILTASINLFSTRGLVQTSIDDIVSAASIGKGTFYKYFKDKDDLFIQCVEAVFYEMYRHIWKEIRDEHDMVKRLFKRSEAFFTSYPIWIDMMNQLRHASIGGNPKYREKFKTILDQIIKPIARDLEVLQKEGKIDPNLDTMGMAHLLMGMVEYGAWLMNNTGYPAKEIKGELQDFIMNGLKKR